MLLIDYLVKAMADNGEGELLGVAQDMSGLPKATTLPEVSNLLTDYKELVAELAKAQRELQTERQTRDEEKAKVAEAEAVKARIKAGKDEKMRIGKEKKNAEKVCSGHSHVHMHASTHTYRHTFINSTRTYTHTHAHIQNRQQL